MAITLYDTQCCGVKEINGISHYNDPVVAMQAFCKLNFKAKVSFRSQLANIKTLFTFYVFTAAVYDLPKDDSRNQSSYYKRYGHAFASLIRKKKLGRVWTTQALQNVAFHPDHCNQVWVWAPNAEALEAWWNANKPKEPKPKPVAAPPAQINFNGNNTVEWVHKLNPKINIINNNNLVGVQNDLGGNKLCGLAAGEGQACPDPVDR